MQIYIYFFIYTNFHKNISKNRKRKHHSVLFNRYAVVYLGVSLTQGFAALHPGLPMLDRSAVRHRWVAVSNGVAVQEW